jgi:hypothetical protein
MYCRRDARTYHFPQGLRLMKSRFLQHGLAFAVAAFLAAGAAAHHSFNMFDSDKIVTLHGTVQEVQWSNPHVILVVNVEAKAAGQPTVWNVECTSPGNLNRIGWTRKSIKAGDKVDVEINPLRDGSAGGAFHKATLLDTGQVFVAGLREAEKAGDSY